MVQKYRRIWSLILAMILLGSCVLSPLSIRVHATARDDHALHTQAGDLPGKSLTDPTEETEADPTEETGADPTEETGKGPVEETKEESAGEAPIAEEDGETEETFEPRMFRWEFNEAGDGLKSIVSDDLTENELTLEEGTISGGVINHVRMALAEPLELRPDHAWSIVWRANGDFAYDDLLFSNETPITTSGNFYIYRQKTGISIGKYDSNFRNLAVTLDSKYNNATERTFRIVNRINEDDSNTVSLYVDGVLIDDFKGTPNWINGTTIRFQYLGADGGTNNGFRLHGSGLKYLLVNEGRDHTHSEVIIPGVPATFRETGLTEGRKCLECDEITAAQEVIPMLEYEPRMFHWVLSSGGDALVSSDGSALTENALKLEEGSISGGTFKGIRYALEEPLELRPDHTWSIEWCVNGNWGDGDLLFSEKDTSSTDGNLYIFRPSNRIALGIRESSQFRNYAASLAGYNDGNQHVIRLENRVNGDGTNMVHLYADGNEIGPLINYDVNGGNQGSTSDWVSGKTFRFRFIGANGHELNGSGFKYLLVNEGIEHKHTPVIIPAVPPQGSQNGLTEGEKCSGCGLILKEQEEVLATGYDARMFCWTLTPDGSALVNSQGELLTENALKLESGKILDGAFSGVQLSMAEPLELRFNQPWSIEWRASGTWAANSLLFSTEKAGAAAGNVYVYRPAAFVALGIYDGSFQNHAAGLTGGNDGAEHTYRLVNEYSAESNTNMVYLYVDGSEEGIPLDRHYVGTALQENPESDWVSGQTFRFRFIGAANYTVNGSGLKYLLVNEGLAHESHTEVIIPGREATETEDGLTEGRGCSECGAILEAQKVIPVLARMFRWNTGATTLDSLNAERYIENVLTQTGGSISAGAAYTGASFAMEKPLILRHNKPWGIEWTGILNQTGADLLFSAGADGTGSGSQYLYRSGGLIALGVYENGQYQNCGISLAGIDTTVSHTYRLANRTAADGSNMVHLYVDNQEIGPLNRQYNGSVSQNKISTWISGKDFRFGFIGTAEHPLNSVLNHIWVNEGISHDHVEELLEAVPATGTEPGLSKGKRCSVCGDILEAQQVVAPLRDSKLEAALLGRKLSILGDDISTYQGVSNDRNVNSNLLGYAYWYDNSKLPVADTWWRQAADRYDMSILVNNSYSGSFVTSRTSTSSMGKSSYGWYRSVNLHDNTMTDNPNNEPVNPDIIAIYMGANDLKTGAACDPAALNDAFYAAIQAEGYEPVTGNFEEAAALMVYRVVSRYPDAEVFLFDLPAMSVGTEEDRTAYNSVFRQLADHYGCTLVDLSASGMNDHSTNTIDGIHPNADGMDVMTEAFADALYARFIASEDAPTAATARGVYLSDLPFIPSATHIGWGEYKKDLSPADTPIRLRVDGALLTFDKGIGAHAPSTVTFNISQYNQEYPRFVAKLGVDANQGSKGNLKFTILGSNALTPHGDNTGWHTLLTTDPLTAASSAVEVDIDVSAYNYLRLYADDLGSEGNDHSVYADARLVTAEYDVDAEYFSRLHTLEWYDEQLSAQDYAENMASNQQLIREREFVSRLGITTIQHGVKDSESLAEALSWLLDDEDALALFLEAGNIYPAFAGTTLQNLDILYSHCRDLLDNYIYKKIFLALVVTWSNDTVRTPYKFGGSLKYIDIVERFAAAKWVYDSGMKISGYTKELYESYNMELMRMVVADYLDIEETQWLQHHAETRYPNNQAYWTGPYRFMGYVKPGYGRPEFFSEDTWPTYDAKYSLSQFNIPRSEITAPEYRLWMAFEVGGVCWNLSRVAQTLNKTFGIPAVGTFQPGHEAYLYYSEDANGQGIWGLGNNVGGWTRAYTNSAGLVYRMPLGWGSNTAYAKTNGNNSTYVVLGQAALNRYGELQESMYLNMLADAYDDPEQKLEVYGASLDALELNLDTYLDIIALYKELGDQITTDQWWALATDIMAAYACYPAPMVDLLDAIEPHLGQQHTVNMYNAKTNVLRRAQNATESDVLQSNICRLMATSLLGEATDDVLATFSFNGENAGNIVLGESYAEYSFQVKYSLDGGATWFEYTKDEASEGRVIVLTQAQRESINAEDDILMYISGESMDPGDDTTGDDTTGGDGTEDGDPEPPAPDYFRIDILEGTAPVLGSGNAATQIAIHDGENWIVGKTEALEYSTDNGESWTPYVEGETRFPGDQTFLVRYAPHRTSLLGPSALVTFTSNNENDKFRHIPIGQVELVSASGGSYYGSQIGEYVLDATPFTGWHSAANAPLELIVRFSEVKSLAGLTYAPGGANGRIGAAEVYVSMNGQDWVLAGSAAGWGHNEVIKTLKLAQVVSAKYVKLVATRTYHNGNEAENRYISGRDIDFYEDTTVEAAGNHIVYSPMEPTRGNVTATLMLEEGFAASNGTEHLFTENGSYSFAYTDSDGREFTMEATVDWIDREAPAATVSFSSQSLTEAGEGIIISLETSEAVTFTDVPAGAEEVFKEGTESLLGYRVHDNGSFTFGFADAAGNTGSATAAVNWIIPADDRHVSFSFSGEDAGTLTLNPFYRARAVSVSYSLDSGATQEGPIAFTPAQKKNIALTPEQLAGLVSLPDMNGEIRVTLTMAEGYERTQTIDLTPGPTRPLVARNSPATEINYHDGENWIVGKVAELEYSADDLHWTPYVHGSTWFAGNQTVSVRYAGSGLARPSESTSLTFTDTNERADFRHISVSKITLVRDNNTGYYQNRRGDLAIDANPFTGWHSSNSQSEENKQIVVAFDQIRQLSGITYQPNGQNGCFSGVEISVSTDNATWVRVGSAAGWPNDMVLKTVTLDRSVPARYVRLQATTHNGYISAQDIDFFEDTTVQVQPVAIIYSTQSPTNADVTATLMLPEDYSSGNKVHTFTKNGTHTFAYYDADGQWNSITAQVTWIDKTPPTATVTYSPETMTDGSVVATITPSETVTITNNGGSLSHTFTANGSFTFTFADPAGNTGELTATVDWITPDEDHVAAFSFSGEMAGQLVLDSFYDRYPVSVTYSVDGGAATNTVNLWKEGTKTVALSAAELDTLLTGADGSGELVVTVTVTSGVELVKTQRIDILSTTVKPVLMTGSGVSAATQIAIHDGENWITGNTAGLEYSTDSGHSWSAYVHGETRFSGEQTVKVRYGARDLTRPGGSVDLTFTEGSSDVFAYIPISRVTLIKDGNGKYWQGHKGADALDANPFTFWHSADNTSKEFIVKLDRETYLAGFTYHVEDTSGGGRFLAVDVYVSLDGQTWKKAGGTAGWTWNAVNTSRNAPRTLTLEQPARALYVKLDAVSTSNAFTAARDFDFYEDTTPQPVAGVGDQHYTTLDEAFAAAGGDGDVKLLEEDSRHLNQAIGMLASLPENAAPTLTIPTASGRATVTLDKAAAQAVHRNAAGTGDIRLMVEDVSGTNPVQGAAATYEITMIQDDVPVYSPDNAAGQATVTVPRPAGLERPVVCHVAEDGTRTWLESTADDTNIRFVTGHFSRFAIEEGAVIASDVSVAEYISLNGRSVWLIRLPGRPEEDRVPTYDGQPMFWSEKYDAFCCLLIAAARPQDAAEKIGSAEGAAVTLTDTMDVNGTGKADASDAQLTYDLYNARYDGFTAAVTMEKFLRADVNGNGRIDTADAVAIITSLLKSS